MARTGRSRDIAHPRTEDIEILDVLHALADPTRIRIVSILREEDERICGTFPVNVAPSTLTHHFRVLREAGVIRQRDEGTRRYSALRGDDLEARFPGLLDRIMEAYAGS